VRDLPSVPARQSRTVGQAITLLLVPTGSTVAFGPAWAVLCGACAAASSLWQEAKVSSASPSARALLQASRHGLVAVVLALFIAEVLWSTWRARVVEAGWAGLCSRGPLPPTTDPALVLPFTTPWSPLGRLQRSWSHARSWLRQAVPAEAAGALPTLAILPPLILILSAFAGQGMALLSLAAICLALIEWRVARRASPHTAMQAALQIGLSWLAGHSAFRQVTMSSFILACCYAISYQGTLSLDAETTPPGARRRSWSLSLLFGGQVAALVLLVLLGHPVVAALVSMLLAPQMLLVSRLGQGEPNAWFLQRALPFLMAAMPIVAWAAQA